MISWGQETLTLLLLCNEIKVTKGQTNKCIAPPPCNCSESSVICSSVGLTKVPEFLVEDEKFQSLYIELDGNYISDIHAYAFSNVSKTNCTYLRIDISGNEIINIDAEAFADVEDVITELQLERNNLTVLPTAISSLKKLASLSIFGNKIKYFDPAIMQTVGLSLTKFKVGIMDGEVWPSSFRYLMKLNELTLHGLQAVSIPFDAFHGYETMLSSLQIEYSKLYMVPTALCSLKSLIKLSFSYNEYLLDRGHIFPMCCPGLSFLRTLIVSHNGLSGFPSVFGPFPNLVNFRITHNPQLTYIDESTTANSTTLFYLDVSSNGFTQIPEALQRFKTLSRLDISNNSIATLEDYNLKNISSLKWLNLSQNPLSYIADTAFRNMNSLDVLLLDNVQLKGFPKAVLDLSRINLISLRYNQIICSCDMKWILSDWKRRSEVTIDGKCCGSGLDIKNYISVYLPQCP